MKAIRINKTGDASVLTLQEVNPPQPGPGEVLVRMKAAGINFIDIYMREGLPRVSPHVPFTPGLEGSGIIEALGEGAYAEHHTVQADHLIAIPANMSFEEAAAFPLQGMTAHYLTHEYYNVTPGTTVLVHAAAGGMGLLLVQWLKKLGARVIGTVSTEEKAKAARLAGADDIILYTEKDFAAETIKLTHGKGADYIIDGVGKTTFTKNLDAIRVRGVICIFGQASGPAEPIAPNALQGKSLTICGGNLMNHLQDPNEIQRRANDVLKGIQEGWLKLNIAHVLPLDQAAEAQHLLETRKTTGKVILSM